MEQQSDTDATAGEVAAEEAAPKKKSGMVVKIVLLVVGLAIGGTAGFTGYERVATMTYSPPPDESDDSANPVEYGEFFEISGIIINPTASVGQRYLMVNIGLEGSAETVADIESKQIVIRDMVIRNLGERTTEELADVTKRDSMKESIRSNVNDILQKGAVDRLYFTQYVIQ